MSEPINILKSGIMKPLLDQGKYNRTLSVNNREIDTISKESFQFLFGKSWKGLRVETQYS